MPFFLDKTASLTTAARRVICEKSTEPPGSGVYNQLMTMGSYLCRRCGLSLFRAHSQFTAGCGWPSFDEGITDAIKECKDADGMRTEILCARCLGHLGHVFVGEHLTVKNRRYCVNSVSIDFVHSLHVQDSEEAIVAGGCFWGVDYYLRRIPGVLKVEVGYCGGKVECPTYQQVCQGNTGHYEAARVVFDRDKTNYTTIIKRFFEIHDPCSRFGQGPDLGQQYQSAVFYYNDTQFEQVEGLIKVLKGNGYDVVTQLIPVGPFWPAEEAHQDYYTKYHKMPYCHKPVERF